MSDCAMRPFSMAHLWRAMAQRAVCAIATPPYRGGGGIWRKPPLPVGYGAVMRGSSTANRSILAAPQLSLTPISTEGPTP